MPISKFTGITTSIQSLPDRPNQNGFTAADIKIRFDQYAIDHKAWTNDVLTEEIDAKNISNDTLISSANTKADNAVITADGASSKSDSAIVTANTAETKADSAIVTANGADTKADNSVIVANNADTIADSALLKATNVETDYNTVKPTLLQAVIDVDSKASVAYVDGIAHDFTLGTIPNDTLTNAKMANEMKKSIVGGVASQDDLLTLDGIVDGHTSSLADSSTQLATGTATAITLAITTLTDLFTKTFIVSADNSGSATTINTKPLYKPNTTTAPNLTSGKAATVWYNLASNCFFIKASATGDALVGDVLAPRTFSNGDDTGLEGTLALTGNAIASEILSGKTAYNTNAKAKITGTLALTGNMVASDLLSGKTGYSNDPLTIITGTALARSTFTAGTNIIDTRDGIDIQGVTPQKSYEIIVTHNGVVRVSFAFGAVYYDTCLLYTSPSPRD